MTMIFSFLKSWYREILILCLSGALWFTLSRSAPQPLEITHETQKIVYVDRVVTKTVEVVRNVTKTVTKPDGTKIVTESHTDTATNVHEEQKQQTTEIAKESAAPAPQAADPYRYSATISLKYNDPRAVYIDVGAQIGNLPVEGVIGFDRRDSAVTLGVRGRF